MVANMTITLATRQARWPNGRTTLYPKLCGYCGSEMRPKNWEKPSDWEAREFCSRTCSAKSRIIPITDRLLARGQRAPSGCLEWTGSRGDRGYGYIGANSTGEVVVHRVAWAVQNGPIPDGLHVLHSCDNPPCFDLNHLFLGTNEDNVRDRVEKGRSAGAPGERNSHAKLTAEQVAAIREDARFQYVVAAEYGVSQSTISAIQRGQTWTISGDTEAGRATVLKVRQRASLRTTSF